MPEWTAAAVRPLRPAEVPAAVATLTLAFDADPLFRYLLPDDADRRAWLAWFHALSLRESLAVDGAFTLAGDDGPALGALALVPPGRWPVSLGATLRAVPFPSRAPTVRLVRAGLHVWRRMSVLHPARERHVYIAVIGVHPARHGQGIGGALLRHACSMADADGAIGYLETGNPANVPLYERFGFRVVETITSHGGPPLWTMLRPRTTE